MPWESCSTPVAVKRTAVCVAPDGTTALHQAAAEGLTDTALALISIGGARIDAADKAGGTPMHMACMK